MKVLVIILLILNFACVKTTSKKILPDNSNETTETETKGVYKFQPEWTKNKIFKERVISIDNKSRTDVQVQAAINAAKGGEKIYIPYGTYIFETGLVLNFNTTPDKPLWIDGLAPGSSKKAVIECAKEAPNNAYTCITFGNTKSAFIVLQNFEIRYGGNGIDIKDAEFLWLDNLEIHHTYGAGINANTNNTKSLYITRNKIHDMQGLGDGIRIGHSSGIYSCAGVIADNMIYDNLNAFKYSGDGIIFRGGTFQMLVYRNIIKNTKLPGIRFFGVKSTVTLPEDFNVFEANIINHTEDNLLQAEGGGAIVRNNLLIGPAGNKALDSSHNEENLRDLIIVHNTIINKQGYGVGLHAWQGQHNLVFANNAVVVGPSWQNNGYAISVKEGIGSETKIAGNVLSGRVAGPVSDEAYVVGNGIKDFTNVGSFDYEFQTLEDIKPAPKSVLIGAGHEAYSEKYDISGQKRDLSTIEAGCSDL